MERVQSMFSNAYGSPAGHLVERATSSNLESEDWSVIMELCDTINAYGDGTKDAVKAIKKRSAGHKSPKQASLILSVVEACIKNCGELFYNAVITKEFCSDVLMKIIQPKNNPSQALQDRVLGMIKTLAEDTRASHSGLKQVYMELQEKGITFPDIKASGFQNPGSKSDTKQEKHKHHVRNQPLATAGSVPYYTGGVINPSPQQIAKVRKDLGVVLGNVRVFSDMLTHLNPLNCDDPDLKLLHELNRTCKAMQQRIVELMEQIGNEEITMEILAVNDDLNNVFLRYERFEKFRANQETFSPSVMPAPHFPSDAHSFPSDAQPVYGSDAQPVYASIPQPHFPSDAKPHYPNDSHSFPNPTQPPIQEPPPSYSESQPAEVNDLIDLSAEATPIVLPPVQPGASKVPDELLQLNLGATFDPFGTRQLTPPNEVPPEEVLQLGSSEQEIEQWLSGNAGALGVSNSNAKPN
uniref:target of Myb protein 1-like n=1 Tax=Ciona intestinalis TaxID=7719 RepID=UPI000180BD29|nr:target of Myb protein 1-like [Ciona intestinalis]|eukprot:XP_018671042.1 target of Myb protein 1-like [Ciona intestinalis]